jgi:phosphoribosylglycinamide formyltransferase 1
VSAPRRRATILISGGGSNMDALIQAASAPGYPVEIIRVISNVVDAGGLVKAQARGIPTTVIDHRPFGKDRAAFEARIDAQLRADGTEIVCLAGFMRVLTAGFVEGWRGRMLNIHPSLLPEFKGLHTHARALDAGVTEHGCTVHLVVPDLDAGPILMQARVPVLPSDDEATLAARVLREEHRIYPEALAAFARSLRPSETRTSPPSLAERRCLHGEGVRPRACRETRPRRRQAAARPSRPGH